jgi:hypothetical protein
MTQRKGCRSSYPYRSLRASVESLEDRTLLSGQQVAYVVAGLSGRDYPVEVVNFLIQHGFTVHTPWWNSTNPSHDNPVPDPNNPGLYTPYMNYGDADPGSFTIAGGGANGRPLLASMDLGVPSTSDAFVKAVVSDLESHYDGGDTVVLIGHGLGGDSLLKVANQVAADEAAGRTTVKIGLLGLLDATGSVDAATNPSLVRGLIDGNEISQFIPSTPPVQTTFFMGPGNKTGPINSDNQVPAFRAGLSSVPSDVTYLYNRWQTNAVLPFDFPVDGTLKSQAQGSVQKDFGFADQAASNQTAAHPTTTLEAIYGLGSVGPGPGSSTAHVDPNFPQDQTIQKELEAIIGGLSFVVTTTADLVAGQSAEGSLRAAILNSNRVPGLNTITFNIKPQASVQDIKLDAPLPPITDPVTIDATTQPGYRGNPVVQVDGSSIDGDGLQLQVGQSTIKGLVVSGFTGAGISLQAGNADLIQNSFLGTDASGTGPDGNGIGILVTGGAGDTIGGTTAGAGNTISGNLTAGIYLDGSAISGTLIEGNRIGTDLTGSTPVVRSGQSDPLKALQNAGIAIVGSMGNTVGGTSVGALNVLSGNYVGLMIAGTAAGGDANRALGNRIGTDLSGANPLGNIVGIYINGAAGNLIGSTEPGAGNIISANHSVGIEVLGTGSSANTIEGNTIGLAADAQGVFRSSNGPFTQQYGVFLQDASGNMVGGAAPGTANVISGNQAAGVFILSRSAVSSGNVVQGNDIGAGVGGSSGPGNTGYGVLLFSAPGNQVVVTGPVANVFGPNGIQSFRNYSGPLPVNQVLAQGNRVHRRTLVPKSARARVHPAGPVHHMGLTSTESRLPKVRRRSRIR